MYFFIDFIFYEQQKGSTLRRNYKRFNYVKIHHVRSIVMKSET